MAYKPKTGDGRKKKAGLRSNAQKYASNKRKKSYR